MIDTEAALRRHAIAAWDAEQEAWWEDDALWWLACTHAGYVAEHYLSEAVNRNKQEQTA